MKDYTLKSHKVSDKIVLDGIEAINMVKSESGLEGHISGGMAVSSYLPIEDHRETIDLDYNLFFGGGTVDYKAITEPLVENLIQKGYSIEYNKRGSTHDYVVKGNGDSLLIQHQRRSMNNFEKHKGSFEREIENQRIISRKDLSYAVLSPEDLVVHKLNRALKFSRMYDVDFPKNMPQKDFKNVVDSLRADVLSLVDSASPRSVARLRLFYDVFDIKSLSKNVGLNKNYFEEVIEDWITSDVRDSDFARVLNRYEIRLD